MAAYADIVEIAAPSSSPAGGRVDITVKVKNKYASTIGIMVGGALEYGVTPWPGISFPEDVVNVAGGATHSFAGWFAMPGENVKIHAYSYYYAGGSWHFDDEMVKSVGLAEQASEFRSIEIVSYERR